MRIGVPKEIKPQENRVGLTPDSVKTLVSEGHEILVESNGGFEAGFENNDYIKAGLPLTSETDFRVLNKEDMLTFPTPNKTVYSFDGNWQESTYWQSDTSYKFNDKIIYQGKAYQMIDPKGYSGLTSANQAIEINAKVLWGQIGVYDDEAANIATTAGLKVVMNRCPKIELFRPFWKPRLDLKI